VLSQDRDGDLIGDARQVSCERGHRHCLPRLLALLLRDPGEFKGPRPHRFRVGFEVENEERSIHGPSKARTGLKHQGHAQCTYLYSWARVRGAMAEADELRNVTGVLKEIRTLVLVLVLLNIALTIAAFI
jgi:hypothetical protein